MKQLRYSVKIGLICLLGMMISSCTSFQTHSDYDSQADFSEYATFAWISDQPFIQPRGHSDPYISPLDLQRIEKTIESVLLSKGYRQLEDNSKADFVVSFTVGARDKIDVTFYPSPYHGSWRWPYYGEAVEAHTYTEGMLAIDIFDRAMGQPVWHGHARKRITGSDTEQAGPLIQEGVAAILSDFPPRATLR